jgi:hypothetical protein
MPEVQFAPISNWAVGRLAGGSGIAIKLNDQHVIMTLADAEAIGKALLCEAEELGKPAGPSVEHRPQTVRRRAG